MAKRPHDFESCASTSSATRAILKLNIKNQKAKLKKELKVRYLNYRFNFFILSNYFIHFSGKCQKEKKNLIKLYG